MTPEHKYEQVKEKATNYRTAILNKIFESRFNTMIDAFTKASSIANTINANINLSTTKFKIFDNPSFIVYPTGMTPNVNNTTMSEIRPYWAGDTLGKTIEGVYTTYIPIPEFLIEPVETDNLLKMMAEKYGNIIYIMEPYDPDKKQYYSLYDAKYGYYTPTNVVELGEEVYAVINPTSIRANIEWAPMILTEAELVVFDVEWVVGQGIIVRFNIEGGMYSIFLVLNARLTIRELAINKVREIVVPYLISNWSLIPDKTLIAPDNQVLSLGYNDSVGVFAPIGSFDGRISLYRIGDGLWTMPGDGEGL